MSLKSILFPISSPDCVRSVLPNLACMAHTLQADVTLMRVIDPFREGGPKPALHELKLIQPEEHGLDRCRMHIQAHSDAAASITQYAREQEVDAIVLPSPRTSWEAAFSRTWSLTKKLLAQSPCPVWLINDSQSSYSSQGEIRRVLCAVSGRDLFVLKAAAEVSRVWNAQLFLLHVIPEINDGTLAYGFDDHVALSVEKGLELLARLQEEAGTEAAPLVQIGSVKETIRRVAQSLNIDLIVTGRQQPKPNSFWTPWQSGFTPALFRAASQMLVV
jgi:nucleotide-binding universal stress UspA family protein